MPDDLSVPRNVIADVIAEALENDWADSEQTAWAVVWALAEHGWMFIPHDLAESVDALHDGGTRCRIDHHGLCQTHNLEPEAECSMARLHHLLGYW